MTLKIMKKYWNEIQLFYDLRTINIISSSLEGRIINHNRLLMAPVQFALSALDSDICIFLLLGILTNKTILIIL